MTKSQLIEALALDQNLSIKTAASIVNTILGTMIETLVKGDNIELRGFGTFTVKEYETYTGRLAPSLSSICIQMPVRIFPAKSGKADGSAIAYPLFLAGDKHPFPLFRQGNETSIVKRGPFFRMATLALAAGISYRAVSLSDLLNSLNPRSSTKLKYGHFVYQLSTKVKTLLPVKTEAITLSYVLPASSLRLLPFRI